ncbi:MULTISPECIES: UPF0738 family protein [Bacillaceae]|jgi:hypothetical protein|uniref:UPF0738 protein ACFFMS_31110 n=1 Tax=Ectobacillus funiculus TaxID=137993 RepID=A0ABV5WPZ1_9BACI|nr:hypothetical protein [Ectobacillus funiculus]
MQKKIDIKSVEQQKQALIFYAENTTINAEELQPREHVLVDSDLFAFLYILENEQEYVYVSIPHTLWPDLKQGLDANQEAVAVINGVQVPLTQLKEEIGYLVQNIEGNANYGEELVKRVEEVFLL